MAQASERSGQHRRTDLGHVVDAVRLIAMRSGPARQLALWSIVSLLALIVLDLAGFHLRGRSLYHLNVGSWGDEALVDGMFAQESDVSGANYRWTSRSSVVHVRGFVAPTRPLLEFTVGGLPANVPGPRPVSLRTDGHGLVTVPVAARARIYQLVLPAAAMAGGSFDLALGSATSTIAPDPRAVGIRLDDIALGWTPGEWVVPPATVVLIQWLFVLVWLGIAWRLRLPRAWQRIVVLAWLILLPLMTVNQLLVATTWESRLLVSSLILLGLAWHALSWIKALCPAIDTERERALLCWVTVVAVTVQLVPVFFPLFGSHDLYIHARRLQDVQLGSLKLFDTPSEFAGRKTIVPSALYVLISPLTLLTETPSPAIQGTYTFAQGLNVILLAVFVRQLGGSSRAALLAAIAIACLPVEVSILWWGFGPQIVGQCLLLLVAVFATRTERHSFHFWVCAGLALCLAFLMHDGVAILGGVWLALYVLLLGRVHEGHANMWRHWLLLLVTCSAVALLLMYSDVITLQLASLAAGASAPHLTDEPTRLRFLWDGLHVSLRPLGELLAGLAIVALVMRSRRAGRYLVVSWVLSALCFLLIDVRYGLQVRYAYFVMPVICAGLGVLLDRLMDRRPWGWLGGWCMLGMLAASGVTLLYGSILQGFKPLLSGLTH